jgi:hypothetical protein
MGGTPYHSSRLFLVGKGGILPPGPLGFIAFRRTGETGTIVTVPVSPHMGQRSGRIPALPYPLPTRPRV